MVHRHSHPIDLRLTMKKIRIDGLAPYLRGRKIKSYYLLGDCRRSSNGAVRCGSGSSNPALTHAVCKERNVDGLDKLL